MPIHYIISAIVLAVLTAFILMVMMRSWNRRSQRDASLATFTQKVQGEPIKQFHRVFYVATTPVDQPLERIAVPGLQFRGFADVTLFSDGVTIEVRGEPGVEIPLSRVSGTRTSQLTIDKVVERDGLTDLLWCSSGGTFASTFRFSAPEHQQDFSLNVAALLDTSDHTPDHSAPQEAQ